MRFRYIEPMFGFEAGQTHICVPQGADDALRNMSDDLVGSDDLIAIYIPQGTHDVYEVNDMRGKVVGAVRLLPMPPGKTTADYFYKDWDGSLRWPVGWPCEAVYAPPIDQCPMLRSLVELLFGPDNFKAYVARFQRGPFELDGRMAKELDVGAHRGPRKSELAGHERFFFRLVAVSALAVSASRFL